MIRAPGGPAYGGPHARVPGRDLAPRGDSGTPAPSAADLARTAGQASGPEDPVQFLGAIAVPEEETCFWLYQAPSAAAVRAAMTAAGLTPERITPAVPIRPPPPAPGPPAAPRFRQHQAQAAVTARSARTARPDPGPALDDQPGTGRA